MQFPSSSFLKYPANLAGYFLYGEVFNLAIFDIVVIYAKCIFGVIFCLDMQ